MHLCVAHKLLDGLAEAGAELDEAAITKAAAAFDKAEVGARAPCARARARGSCKCRHPAGRAPSA